MKTVSGLSLFEIKSFHKSHKDGIEKHHNGLILDGLQYGDDSQNELLLYASMYLTHKCQLRCIYCSKHHDINAVNEGKIKVLSYEERVDFIKKAKQEGLKTLILQGMAEPMEDEHFRDYILLASSLNIQVILFSNIINLTDEMAEFLYKNNVSIAPSIDTLRQDTYNFMTCSNKYDQFIDALKSLKKFYGGKDKWVEGRAKVLVSMVLTSYNVDDLPNIRKMCNENGWLLCSKAFGVKGAAKDNFDSLAYTNDYYVMLQELAMLYADKVMITQTSEGKCACGGKGGILVDIDGSIGACGDTLTRVGANIRTHTINECLQAKRNYVSKLGDYVCLSKALRGFGDVRA